MNKEINTNNKNNSLLDCFRKPSETLKNFIVKYQLWWHHNTIEDFKNTIYDENKLIKSLSNAIMKEKKDNRYLFCSSLRPAPYYGVSVASNNPIYKDKEFFYGNENEVKDKITNYLLKLEKLSNPAAFFCVYDFVNDYESGIAYGSNLVDGKTEYIVSIE